MKNLEIPARQEEIFSSPHVSFNTETGVCEISGESFLDKTIEFYNPLYNWLEKYIKQEKKPIKFIFRLSYFNTSSSKCLLNILETLKDYEDDGGSVEVKWYYEEDDKNLVEDIEDFSILTELEINMIKVKNLTPHNKNIM